MSFSHWLVWIDVFVYPSENGSMMIDGIPNRPLYFYQQLGHYCYGVLWYIRSQGTSFAQACHVTSAIPKGPKAVRSVTIPTFYIVSISFIMFRLFSVCIKYMLKSPLDPSRNHGFLVDSYRVTYVRSWSDCDLVELPMWPKPRRCSRWRMKSNHMAMGRNGVPQESDDIRWFMHTI